ncbi:Uma2 family endonuclease [Leptothermofonsia sichuanensis E412]|uniref:Uma2 family endonuclease n=1 Tax=Leptothermofonsia sichuanensis TaxID=2917832 RepID=UPI001CA7B42B|nr:Uma2 family endonuclease [Leptothermofonsia sichuanensis]QZZ21195.1 Uma2 family endonuclease [Leptothermofonsia sichuanensis E412]
MNLKLENAVQQQVEEQRFLLSGVTWEQYETLRATLDDFPGLRMTYLEGMLELFMPSEEHEDIKTTIARLLELYAIEKNVRLYGYGSATYRKKAKERGLEPDECYYLNTKKEFPDIAIEVIVTRGLLDKLEVYRGLGVPEVWIWQQGQLVIYHLSQENYEPATRSEFLPDLDLDLLMRCASMPDQHDAVVAFRDALQ